MKTESDWKGNFYLPEPPTFESWGQYTRDARDYSPRALNYGDESPWTQETLAGLIGVDKNYVSIIERGEKEPGQQFRLLLNYLLIMARNGLDPRAR